MPLILMTSRDHGVELSTIDFPLPFRLRTSDPGLRTVNKVPLSSLPCPPIAIRDSVGGPTRGPETPCGRELPDRVTACNGSSRVSAAGTQRRVFSPATSRAEQCSALALARLATILAAPTPRPFPVPACKASSFILPRPPITMRDSVGGPARGPKPSPRCWAPSPRSEVRGPRSEARRGKMCCLPSVTHHLSLALASARPGLSASRRIASFHSVPFVAHPCSP
jgi:hypothetical protein